MANSSLFAAPRNVAPACDTVNNAGGRAYNMTPVHSLAQLATTGCFQNTFYTSAKDQLNKVKSLAYEVDPVRLAKIVVMARTQGFMKDMPAFLAAVLYLRDRDLW